MYSLSSPGQGASPRPSPSSPPSLPRLALDDLPDEVVDVITVAAYSAGGHSGLFSASRPLAAIGPVSIIALTVRRRFGLDVEAAAAASLDGALHADFVLGVQPLVDLGAMPALFDAALREFGFLSRALRLRAVLLHSGHHSGVVCAACEAAAALTGDGCLGEPPASDSIVAGTLDRMYAG